MYLKRKLDRAAGHDSTADAKATMDLVLLKLEKGLNFGVVRGENAPLGRILRAAGTRLSLSGDVDVPRGPSASWLLEGCEGRCVADDAAIARLQPEGQVNGPAMTRDVEMIVLGRLEMHCKARAATDELAEDSTETAAMTECLEGLDAEVARIVSSLDRNELFLTMSGCGDVHRMRRLERETQPGTPSYKEARRRARAAFGDPFFIFASGGDIADAMERKAEVSVPAALVQGPPRRELVHYDI
mmetsp:Transcript_21014/g.46301  ORF Transcript_21014/g.46301 Transcript_21014/m.46301 type:complete len:243 (-) Transcript_21014:46-774(-)